MNRSSKAYQLGYAMGRSPNQISKALDKQNKVREGLFVGIGTAIGVVASVVGSVIGGKKIAKTIKARRGIQY